MSLFSSLNDVVERNVSAVQSLNLSGFQYRNSKLPIIVREHLINLPAAILRKTGDRIEGIFSGHVYRNLFVFLETDMCPIKSNSLLFD